MANRIAQNSATILHIQYNNQTIAELASGETTELQCDGKVMNSDIIVTANILEYSGSYTLS